MLGMSSMSSFCAWPSRGAIRGANMARGDGAKYVGRFDGTEKASVAISEVEEARAAEGSRGKTSTKWSILSERMEGLARELYMVTNSLDPYIKDMSDAEGPAMKAIREKMDSTDWADLWESKKTMFSYGGE